MPSLPASLNAFGRSRLGSGLLIGAAGVLVGSVLSPTTSRSQQSAVATPLALSAETFNTLIGQLRTQQEQIAANQTKIEAQLAEAKEQVRLARIAASRTGSGASRR